MSSLTAGWENFLVAEAGAAAALSGLVFVSVSISLQKILASPHLRDRASETLMMFLSVLAITSCGLIPDQGPSLLGAEITGLGGLVWLASSQRQLRAYRDPGLDAEARRWLWLRVVGTQASYLPFIAAGTLLITGHEHALWWLAPGTLATFGFSALNAWVLLVEIQR